MKRIAVCAALASLAWAGPAKADYSSPMHLDAWQVVQLGQCKAVLNMGSFRLDPSGVKDEGGWDINKTEWTGACDANGMIDGPGTIRFYTWIVQGGDYFTNYYFEYRVNAVGGMLEGPVTLGVANWDSAARRYGAVQIDPIDPSFGPRRFEGGCLRDEWEEPGCDPAVGARFLRQFLGARAPAPVPPPVVAPVPAPVAVVVPPPPVMAPPVGTGTGSSGSRTTEVLKLVSNGLIEAIGSGGSSAFGNKQDMISGVLSSLASALGQSGSPLAGDPGLADAILGVVAGKLSRAEAGQSTGQIIDLVNGVVSQMLQQGTAGSPTLDVAPAPFTAGTAAPAAPGTQDLIQLDAASLTRAFSRLGETIAPDGGAGEYLFFKEAGNYYSAQLHCPAGGPCDAIILRACYSYPNASIGRANAYNKEKLFLRAYISDSGNLCLDEVIHGQGGTVPFSNFERAFAEFESAIGQAKARFDAP
jgi:hypothetical protein